MLRHFVVNFLFHLFRRPNILSIFCNSFTFLYFENMCIYQGGSRSFHLFRNFSKILKSRWKMLLKKLVDSGSFYIFHFYWIFINKYSQLLQKLAEISDVQIFVNDFCTFYKKLLKNFWKISSGIFLNSDRQLPPWFSCMFDCLTNWPIKIFYMAAWIKVVCFQNTQNALCEKYTGGDFISISKLFFRII